jgi:hypothetical protein
LRTKLAIELDILIAFYAEKNKESLPSKIFPQTYKLLDTIKEVEE